LCYECRVFSAQSGGNQRGSSPSSYYRFTHAILICFDLSQPRDIVLNELKHWVADAKRYFCAELTAFVGMFHFDLILFLFISII
jgi:hypothetical protein